MSAQEYKCSNRAALLLTGILLCSISCNTVAQSSAVGRRLVDYIESLRSEGLIVIYSSELVPDSLTLESEPSGRTPRRRLRSVLEELDLSLERGPRDTWLIVRLESDVEAELPEAAVPERFDPPPVPPLENVIVTASRYAFARDPVATGTFLDRLQIEATPSVSDDALRPVANVPGVSSNGLSGRMSIRGGAADETLILLDGVEFLNPFHLKDFESIFGSISPRLVDMMNVYTGGFSAKYGGRMSGVIDIQPIEPTDRRHHEVSVGTINTSLLSSGRFASDRSSWLVSLRRGNVDLLLDAANSDFGQPQYTDFFGRMTTSVNDAFDVRFGLASLNDKISLNDNGQTTAGADYDDTYLWLGLSHSPSDAFKAEYLLSFADTDSLRNGVSNIPDVTTSQLSDRRAHSNVRLKGDWTYSRHSEHWLGWGAAIEDAKADYEFVSLRQLPVPIITPMEQPSTGEFAATRRFPETLRSAYLSYRWRPKAEFTLELGGRFDDWSTLNERVTSPRIGAVWNITDRIALRAARGRYAQGQNVNEVQVSDQDVQRHRPQISDQSVLSIEYDLTPQAHLRIEVFEKQVEHPRPRFENLFTRLSLLPELLPDRVLLTAERARSSGFEVSYDADLRDWRWWFSYSRSTAEDLFKGEWIRRSWQESWSGKAGFVRTGDKWTISSSLVIRSGWPISGPIVQNAQVVVPAMNSQTFEKFRSVDFKASRHYRLRRSDFELYFELINVLDDGNDCCFEYSIIRDIDGRLTDVATETQQWLPSVPVVGFRWSL